MTAINAPISQVEVSTLKFPLNASSAMEKLVVVEACCGDIRGIGYAYGPECVAHLIEERLSTLVEGQDAMNLEPCWVRMIQELRGLGGPSGIGLMALSALDAALWDLKARLLGLPLVSLLGQVRAAVPVHWSGGFAGTGLDELGEELESAAECGFSRFKIRVWNSEGSDRDRIRTARTAIGLEGELLVDGGCEFSVKSALHQAEIFNEYEVSWFENPVPGDDFEALRLVREGTPARMRIVSGKEGQSLPYFRRLLEARAIDTLEIDATRCGGITAFLKIAAICEASGIPVVTSSAPAMHVALGCAVRQVAQLECRKNHLLIESQAFDLGSKFSRGALLADLTRPGNGLELRRADLRRYAA